MKWVKFDEGFKVPIKSWCEEVDASAMEQATNLARHPLVAHHVALMPDCHGGYGMPIGGVIACKNGVIPNAVGVDIGCGMGAIRTDVPVTKLEGREQIREIVELVKKQVPVGEGNAHKHEQEWKGFEAYLAEINADKRLIGKEERGLPGWLDEHSWKLALCNLGTLGGGNHFIELDAGDDGNLWLMLHSGSRNLGYRIASYYHGAARELNDKWYTDLPATDLAFLPTDSDEGASYLRDMNFALLYAKENRQRMMDRFKEAVARVLGSVSFTEEINIHHNYAALEHHAGSNLWVHRKGATSAKTGEPGIIPGSMGTPSYIVRGLGNPESFESCSHGAGRRMGRIEASKRLTIEECDKVMGDIVFDRWSRYRSKGKQKENAPMYDLGEAPLAYKDIDEVIEAEADLVETVTKLRPLGVVKG